MSRITNLKLINSVDAINTIGELRLPAPLAFKFSLAMLRVQELVQVFETTRMKLIERYGTKTDDGSGNLVIRNGQVLMQDADGFKREFNALTKLEVDVEIEPFQISELGSVEVEPRHLATLSWMISL